MRATETTTVSDCVSRAAGLCDPDGHDDSVRALVVAFEDDDRAAHGLEALRDELHDGWRGVDPAGESPAAAMTAATAFYLSGVQQQEPTKEVAWQEGARVLFGNEMPEGVRAWLEARGVGSG